MSRVSLSREGQDYEDSRKKELDPVMYEKQQLSSCPLCKDAKPNMAYVNGVAIRIPIATYAPGHFMLMPQAHVNEFTDFKPEEFKSFVGVASKIMTGMKLRGLPMMLLGNHKIAGGQSVPHVHAHLVPLSLRTLETKNLQRKGFEVQDVGQGIYFDPLAMQVMHSMKKQLRNSKHSVLRKALVPTERGEGVILRFDSFAHLARSHAAVSELFGIAQQTFDKLEQNPESAVQLPNEYFQKAGEKSLERQARAKLESDKKLLKTGLLGHYTDAKENFGAHYMIVQNGNKVEFHFLPRATTIITVLGSRRFTPGKVTKIPAEKINHFMDLAKRYSKNPKNERQLIMELAQLRTGVVHYLGNFDVARIPDAPTIEQSKKLDAKALNALKKVVNNLMRRK